MIAGPEQAQQEVVEDSLGRQVRVGLGWSMANTVVSRGWAVTVGLILARLLDPRDYGIFAVGFVALNILQSMNELGVSVAVVRWQGDPNPAARTAVTMSIASSMLLYLGCYLAAPRVASALQTPEATGVLRLLTLGVLLDGISSIPNAFLTRTMLQARRAVADTASLVVSTAVTLILATRGAGAWSLAWGSLAGNFVATALICLLAPVRPRPGFDRADARRLLSFGLPLAGSSFMVFAMLNADYVIVGRVLGPVTLGFYVLAFNLSSWPTSLLSFSIRRVSIAGFARLLHDEERLRSRFVTSLATLVTVVIPIVVVLSVLASPLVRILYGDRWSRSIQALRFLAILGGARVAFDLCYDVLVGAGRSRSVLWVQALWLAALIPALSVGAAVGGIRGVGIAHTTIAVFVVAPAFLAALWKMGIAPARIGRPLVRPVVAGALAAGIALVVSRLVSGSDILQILAAGAATTVVYVLTAVPVRRLVKQW